MTTTAKQWEMRGETKGFDELHFIDTPIPNPGQYEVLVKFYAASLNYRDITIPKGLYPKSRSFPRVPGSDGAGVVVQVGDKVKEWKEGDRVVTLFHQDHQYGGVTPEILESGLGGTHDGTLREYGLFKAEGLVRAPKNLTLAEAGTLSCAALTSWNALYGLNQLKPGQTVLVQGTGGVSMFALQFAKAAGAFVIATTSNDDKAKLLRDLGADHVINYKTEKNWGQAVKALTRDGAGVDNVVEVGGAGSLEQSLEAIKYEGTISIVGYLGGLTPKATLLDCLFTTCVARGVYIGSRQQMQDMVAAIEANDIHPVTDKEIFTLERAKDAYQYMWDQKHFGKLVIKIAEE